MPNITDHNVQLKIKSMKNLMQVWVPRDIAAIRRVTKLKGQNHHQNDLGSK